MSTPIEKTQNIKRISVSVNALVPADNNPNKMSAREFDLLVDNIRRVGITDPILAVPFGDQYKIVGGHHRWEAAKFLEFTEVPVNVIDDPDFDEEAMEIQIVRHNVIHGQIAPDKFFDMYKKYHEKYPGSDLASLFGFADQKEFEKLIQQTKKSLPKDMQKAFINGVKDIKTIEGLSALLQKLFEKHGNTLPYGYMIVDYGGKDNLWVQLDSKGMKAAFALAEKVKGENKSVGEVFSKLLQLIADKKLDPTIDSLIKQALDVEA